MMHNMIEYFALRLFIPLEGCMLLPLETSMGFVLFSLILHGGIGFISCLQRMDCKYLLFMLSKHRFINIEN